MAFFPPITNASRIKKSQFMAPSLDGERSQLFLTYVVTLYSPLGKDQHDESRLNIISDDKRVCVWRPLGERLNPAFTLRRHTSPTAGMIVWGVISNNTMSLLVLIRFTMTAQGYAHDILQPLELPLMKRLPRAIILTRWSSASQGKGVTRQSPPYYYPSLVYSIPRFVSNRAYLGSFGKASWASHEFHRARCNITANMP
ncbi:transposable element Tcb1 transposase [Trichonephila clavipes]|uniref:Transposable element Tcb1 transposase n=1 Tax=Trichonephila clavipes TaxID=2585209 RepID=A0A8X6RPU2_TRICX|nr:transposable element Tcb1 transposase [Trichonephila clavipes]